MSYIARYVEARLQEKSFNLPKDLTRLNDRDIEDILNYYIDMPTNRLRKRQKLNQDQSTVAYLDKNMKAMNNLAIDSEFLQYAIMIKEFGDVTIDEAVDSVRETIRGLR